MKTQQQGFVLLSVLILTTISTLVAFSALNETRLQEQIGGNQQKELNARMKAEKGIFDSFDHIATANDSGSTLEDIKSGLGNITDDHYEILTPVISGKTLSFISKGTYHGATAYLEAQISLSSGINLFENGVVACDGITLSGSGQIDSYDSSNGAYDSSNFNRNANVATINANADVTLSGASPIYGNVTVNGDFASTGSASLAGDVSAVGDVNMSGGVGPIDRVTGDINAGGNMTLNGTIPIGGDVNVVGDFNYSKASSSTIGGDLTHGGSFTGPNWIDDHSGLANSINNATPTAPSVPSQSCDPADIATQLSGISGFTSNGDMTTAHWQTADSPYEFKPGTVEMFNSSATDYKDIKTAQDQDLMGESMQVHVFDDFTLKNGEVNVSGGDVVIVVKGDFTTAGNPSSINIEAGSSLTIMVEGKVNVGSGSDITASGSLTSNGKPPVSIFSAYESKNNSDKGVVINGAGDMYASVYAPLTHVDVGASGDLMGALRGKTVVVDGAGGMHYDEALGNVSTPIGDSVAKFASLHYHYPD